MAERIVNDDRTLLKYQKRMERELTRLRIENNIAVTLRDMEKGIGELVERERQRNLTATYTNIIMENSSDRFILLDENLRLLLLSHNFETPGIEKLEPGIELKTLIGLLPHDDEGLEGIEELYTALNHIMKTGESIKHPLVLGQDDEARYFDMTAKGVLDDGSGHKGVVLTFAETTAVTRAMQEAQSADKAKSAFLANMSHEIRTPINAIVGISEIALERGGLSNEMQSDLSIIQNSATGLLSIINDILDFSKIESGKFQIVPAEYTLPSMLMDICNVISVKLANSQVRLLMNTDASLPFNLYGDDIRVKQILMNLLNNATKFTHTGFIELRVEGERLPDNKVKLIFKIIDSGIGIKKEDLKKLFGTFSQVDTQRNRSINGSGLGLAISKNLSEAMGGGISVESEYGSGSTFIVTIIQEVRGDETIGSVANRDKVRMLVVEDDEILIDSIGRTLDNLGVEWQLCHLSEKIRTYTDFTHVLVLRKNFEELREKIEFMFSEENIYLILDQGEMASTDYVDYKQMQLQLLSLQIINALNGKEIVSSVKKAEFERSQIIPLTFAHVLVVDDNATNLQVAKGLMLPYKMQIDTASSGYKAIELVKNNKYDAIFMDHMMPEMDGVETTQHIRELDGDYYKNVPIIALTANAMSDAKEMFLSSGMDDFVSKPIEVVQLNRVIKKFIESKAPEGYIESYQKSKATEKSVANTVSSTATSVPAIENIAVSKLNLNISNDGIRELLQQNNLLINQNNYLLQQLLRSSGVESSEVNVVNAVKEIPNVNMDAAIEGCGGSKEIYEEILKTYFADLKDREKEVQALFEAKDIKGFTIVVHALKSASRSIGAADLGEAAYSLEMHGKAEEWDAIEKEFPVFMTALREMKENVGIYLGESVSEEVNASNDKEQLESFNPDAVNRLKDACSDMDYMLAEDILREIDEYAYPEAAANKLALMLKACADFDYDTLEKLVEEE